MEQHPVPQNVTTFQFRLIGDMTIKQFGYLAIGAVLAIICYKLPLPFFFTWPLTVLSALGGFGFAFVPIEERPMDVWISAFIKNVYSPTQYVWQKTKTQDHTPDAVLPALAPKVTPPPQPMAAMQPVAPVAPQVQKPISSTETHIHPRLSMPHIDMSFFTKLFAHNPPKAVISQPKAQSVAPPMPPIQQKSTIHDVFANIKTPSVTGKPFEDEPAQQPAPKQSTQQTQTEATEVVQRLEHSASQIQKELQDKTANQHHILELQEQLAQVLSDKEKMEHELIKLRQQMEKPIKAPQVTRPAGVVPAPIAQQPSVRVIAAEGAIHAGLPKLTTFPNVVTGIIKDNLGNLLTGMLVTVRDKDDVPLRALKTNKLGQFAASTPLPNGTYMIEIEDPRGNFTFDRAQITLVGSLIPAIEVTARSQKQIARDKLAQQIFGDTPS